MEVDMLFTSKRVVHCQQDKDFVMRNALFLLFCVLLVSLSVGCGQEKFTEEEAREKFENERVLKLEEENADLRSQLVTSQEEILNLKLKNESQKAQIVLKDVAISKICEREIKITERETAAHNKEIANAAKEGGFAERDRDSLARKSLQDERENKYREVVIGREKEFNETVNSALSSLLLSLEKLSEEQSRLARLRMSRSGLSLSQTAAQEGVVGLSWADSENKLKELIALYRGRKNVLDTFP